MAFTNRFFSAHSRKLLFSFFSGSVCVFYSPLGAKAEEALQTRLLSFGGNLQLDIFVDEIGARKFIIHDLALASEIEAAIDSNGALHIRQDTKSNWENTNAFAQSGWFSSLPKASQVHASQDMVFVVDADGGLWERQKNGSFGKIALPEEAREVKVAEDRTAVVARSGRVYFRGSNEFGQSGLGQIAHTEGDFVPIPDSYFYGQVVEVALGGRHSLFRTSNGHVYSCGSNDNMQLGLPWTREKVWLANEDWNQIVELPARVQFEMLEKQEAIRSYYDTKTLELRPRVCLGRMFDGYVRAIAAGENHSVALISKSLRSSAEVWSWGSSMRGQLGHRNTTNMAEPNSISMLMKYDEFDDSSGTTRPVAPIQIATGKNHTLVTLKGPHSTMVFGLGDNTKHQISTVRQRKFTQPVWLKKISPMNGVLPMKVYAGENKSAIFCNKIDLLAEVSGNPGQTWKMFKDEGKGQERTGFSLGEKETKFRGTDSR